MDCTQVLDDDDFNQDESVVKIQVGYLKVNNEELPIYEGVNIIGRDDSCDVTISAQAISKKHAVIEVEGKEAIIYDLGSRNKTKKEKVTLKPSVRYELKNGNELIFGNIKCQYFIQSIDKTEDDTGSITASETGSESMIPEDEEKPIVAGEDSSKNNDSANQIKESLSGADFSLRLSDEEKSNDSDSILLPTQQSNENLKRETGKDHKTPKELSFQKAKEEAYAAETDEETDSENEEDNGKSKDGITIIGQTPGFDIKKGRENINEENIILSESILSNQSVSDTKDESVVKEKEEIQKKIDFPTLDNDSPDSVDIHMMDTLPLSEEDQISAPQVDKNIPEVVGAAVDTLADVSSLPRDTVEEDEEVCGTYQFDTEDFNESYDGGDEKECEDGRDEKNPEKNEGKLDDEKSKNDLQKGDEEKEEITDVLSQEIPVPVRKFATSTQLAEGFQSFGTPTSDLSNISRKNTLSSTESLGKYPKQLVVGDSEDEVDDDATQAYAMLSPEKPVFKIPEENSNQKNSSLPGASPSVEFYNVVDRSTHMSSGDEQCPKNMTTGTTVKLVDENENVETTKNDQTNLNDETTQLSAKPIDLDGETQEYAGGVEYEGETQSYSDKIDLEAATQCYAEPVDLNAATQAYAEPVDLNVATQAYAEPVDLNVATQAYAEPVDLNAPTQQYKDDVDLDVATQAYVLPEEPNTTAESETESEEETNDPDGIPKTKNFVLEAVAINNDGIATQAYAIEEEDNKGIEENETKKSDNGSSVTDNKSDETDADLMATQAYAMLSENEESPVKDNKRTSPEAANNKKETPSPKKVRFSVESEEEDEKKKKKRLKKYGPTIQIKRKTTRAMSERLKEINAKEEEDNESSEVEESENVKSNESTPLNPRASKRTFKKVKPKGVDNVKEIENENESKEKKNNTSNENAAKNRRTSKSVNKKSEAKTADIETRNKKLDGENKNNVANDNTTANTRTSKRSSKNVEAGNEKIETAANENTTASTRTSKRGRKKTKPKNNSNDINENENENENESNENAVTNEHTTTHTTTSKRANKKEEAKNADKNVKKIETENENEENENVLTKENTATSSKTSKRFNKKSEVKNDNKVYEIENEKENEENENVDSEEITTTNMKPSKRVNNKSEPKAVDNVDSKFEKEIDNKKTPRSNRKPRQTRLKNIVEEDSNILHKNKKGFKESEVDNNIEENENENNSKSSKSLKTKRASRKDIKSTENYDNNENNENVSSGNSELLNLDKVNKTENEISSSKRGSRSRTRTNTQTKEIENKETEKASNIKKVTRGKRKLTDTNTEANNDSETTENNDTNTKDIKLSNETNKISVDTTESDTDKNSTTNIQAAASSSRKRKATESKESHEQAKTDISEYNDSQVSLTPRRKSVISKPKVVFTGMSDKNMEKLVKDLGGEVVDSVKDATYLVTDKIRRTVKFLCALSRGIPILGPNWLKSVKSANMFTTWKSHVLKDSPAEKKFQFNLQRSLEKACTCPLLQDYSIHITKNVKPEPQAMKEIIECASGEFLPKPPKNPSDKLYIISCEEDVKVYEKFTAQGFTVCSNELLLTGILRQELEPKSFLLGNIEENLKESQDTETTSKRRKKR